MVVGAARMLSMDETKRCPACFEEIDLRAWRCPKCAQRQADAPGLYRGVPGKLVGGVCAALAVHFNWDVMLTRVVLLAVVFLSGGVALWVYGGLWALTPYEARGRAPAQRLVDWLGRLFSQPPASRASDPRVGP